MFSAAPAKEVTNLTLAGAFLRFKGHCYSCILVDIVFKNILIMQKWDELVRTALINPSWAHQLFSDLHLKAEAIFSKSSTAPLFHFFPS